MTYLILFITPSLQQYFQVHAVVLGELLFLDPCPHGCRSIAQLNVKLKF